MKNNKLKIILITTSIIIIVLGFLVFKQAVKLVKNVIGKYSDTCEMSVSNDSFYYSKGGFDYKRIPLKEPFELINTGFDWYVRKYDPSDHSASIRSNIEKVGIKENYIHLYSKNNSFKIEPEQWKWTKINQSFKITNYSYPEVWTIINTENDTENIFTSKDSYEEYLQRNNIENVELIKVDKVFENLSIQCNLQWFPNN